MRHCFAVTPGLALKNVKSKEKKLQCLGRQRAKKKKVKNGLKEQMTACRTEHSFFSLTNE